MSPFWLIGQSGPGSYELMTGSGFFFRLATSHNENFGSHSVERGFNSDVSYKGCTFHVQTEDWGSANPYFVSQVFRSGEVIRTFKIHYTKVLPENAMNDPRSVRLALEVQHHSILDLLVSGQLF